MNDEILKSKFNRNMEANFSINHEYTIKFYFNIYFKHYINTIKQYL